MGNEIRVQSEVIYDALSELKSSVQSLDTSFSKTIEGDNNLELVDKINSIKQSFDELLTKYEALMLQNIASTEEAIEKYKETDEHIKASIR